MGTRLSVTPERYWAVPLNYHTVTEKRRNCQFHFYTDYHTVMKIRLYNNRIYKVKYAENVDGISKAVDNRW
jgi:hypothetical protein